MTQDEQLELLPVGETLEVQSGVTIERRSFLRMLSVALGLAAIPGIATARFLKLAKEPLTFAEFLTEVIPTAKKLVADTTLAGQDRYLQFLASYAVRVTDVAQPEFRDSGQGAGPGTFIGFNPGGDPFNVLHWKMEPNTIIRPHAHTYGNVVTLGLEGQIRVVNYELVGPRDFAATGTFQVRQTADQQLGPGQINLVNLEKNYIHGFQAGPKGGRGLDITTRIKEKQPTPYLALSANAGKSNTKILEASWTT